MRSKRLAIRADEREAVLQRFMSKVEKSDGHWLWTGAKSGEGYGQFGLRGVPKQAHRVAYALFNGPIPAGLLVRHLCNVPLCMNPEHFALGTDEDNHRDKVEAGRQAKGETNGRTKLWQLEAEHIKRRALDGESPTSLAREFGLDSKAVRLIRDGVNWKHVEPVGHIAPLAPPEVEIMFGMLFSSREARDDAWGRLVGRANLG